MGPSFCPECNGPKYRYARYCNKCKAKGPRNARFGAVVSEETKERIRASALAREYHPAKKRNPHSIDGGRIFARRWMKMPERCEICLDARPIDRHHKDGNTQNNDRSNIAFLCRRCHQKADGRYDFIKNELPSLGGMATAAKRMAQEVLPL